GARALARRADVARADQLPQPGDRQADAGQERPARAAAGGGRGAAQEPRLVDQEGPGLAPPARTAHGLAAAAAAPPAPGRRSPPPPGAAPCAGVEPAG